MKSNTASVKSQVSAAPSRAERSAQIDRDMYLGSATAGKSQSRKRYGIKRLPGENTSILEDFMAAAVCGGNGMERQALLNADVFHRVNH